MTIPVTTACTACGALNLGTKFCESCGAPATFDPSATEVLAPDAVTAEASRWQEPTVSELDASPLPSGSWQVPSTPRSTFGATPVRVFALLSFLLANTAPPLVEYAVYAAGGQSLAGTYALNCTLISFTGLFLVIAALAGRAGAASKSFGALFALAYTGIAIFLVFGGVRDFYGYTNSVLLGFTYLLVFLSWGLGRPFRGPGYFGLLILVLVVSTWDLVQGIPILHSNYVGYLVTSVAVFAGSLWLTVGLSSVFEGKPRSGATRNTRPLPATNSLAIAGFVLSLVGILISPLTILAIIFGHISRSQVRHTGQQGKGLALAALVIGYFVLASYVAIYAGTIIIQIVTLSQLANSSIGY